MNLGSEVRARVVGGWRAAHGFGCMELSGGYGSGTARSALQEISGGCWGLVVMARGVGEAGGQPGSDPRSDPTESGEVWLPRVQRRLSPNRDARPAADMVELVVVHNISLPPGRFGTGMVAELFCNELDCTRDAALTDLAGLEVSAHLFIDRRGRATQFVPFDQRAWHAGVSSWRGRPRCNDFAIGIELEGTDERAYTRKQYQRLLRVLRWLFAYYPRLDRGTIVGHNEIAPGRKTDPGAMFDWQQLLSNMP